EWLAPAPVRGPYKAARLSGVRMPARPAPWLCGLRRHFTRLVFGFLDRADHVESGFRQVIVFTVDNRAETLDRIGKLHELAGRAGKNLGDVEGLRQEALDLPGAGHR